MVRFGDPNNGRFRMAVFLLAMLLVPAAFAQEKVLLQRRGTVGESSRYEGQANLALGGGGLEINVVIKQKTKLTVKEVNDYGFLTLESELEEMNVSFNGQEFPTEEAAGSKTVLYVDPTGLTTVLETDMEAEDDSGMTQRISQASQVIFSSDPVGPGDKWSHSYPGDKEALLPKAKVEFTFEDFETVSGVRAARLAMNYVEDQSGALKGTGKVWIDVASGETIKTDLSLSGSINLEGMESKGDIKITDKRVSGGLMAVETVGTDEGMDEGDMQDEGEGEDEENIDSTVEGFEKLEGLFPIYRKQEDDGRLKLYMEIPRANLDQYYMLQTTASTGDSASVVAGDPISDLVFQFQEKPNNMIYMVVPNFGFRADEHAPIMRAVKRSFSESYVEAFDIEAKQSDRDSVLIDISDLFLGNIGQVYDLMMGGGGGGLSLFGGGGYSPDREKSYVDYVKNFPENVAVRSIYAFDGTPEPSMGGPTTTADSRSLVVAISYNLFKLETESGFEPRAFDARVGYFTVDFDDMTDFATSTAREQLIMRWHLEKQDPDAQMSEPVEPIVFWLDNAIPDEYRMAVREGILAWNKAFEKIGYRNAIQVKQMPADADFDHSDLRYNIVRWVASPASAYAVAHFRTNPLTGEIVNASITVDANMVRFGTQELGEMVDPTSFFKKPTKEELLERLSKRGRCADCDYAHYALQQKELAGLAIEMVSGPLGPVNKQKYLDDLIRHVVAHEMGHILGLRHNFVASTQLTLEEMKDPAKVAKYNTAASVMDYVPFNPSAIKSAGLPYYSATLGEYDIWAIEYGYSDSVTSKADLDRLARGGAAKGLRWLGDEYADFYDPYVARFDISKEPIDYYQRMLQLSRYLIFELDKHSPRDGESYYEFTKDFNSLFANYSSAAARLSNYIGSYRKFNDFKGDPGGELPMQAVEADKQRRAFDLLKTYIFSERAFAFPKHYYQMFARDPKGGILESMLAGLDDYSMFDQFAGVQGSALSSVMNPGVLNRLWNFEFKAAPGEKVLTARTLLREVQDEVWSELKSGTSVSPLRRQLQREHINMLIQSGVPDFGASSEVSAMAWDQLRKLRTTLQAASRRGYDEATSLHVRESLMRVDRALNAIETIGGSSGPVGGGSILDLLMGRGKGK